MHELHGAEGPSSEVLAAAGTVGDFEPLPGAGEGDCVVADDVAAAQAVEADGATVALAGFALAAVHGVGSEVPAQRLGEDFAHAHGSSGRCVDFVAVVRFEDLHVHFVAKNARCLLDQHEGDVDADAHVGREQDGDALGGLVDGREAFGV